jgi:hypothetical protein
MPGRDEKFWEWLSAVDCSKIRIYAHPEGSMCFPKVPLLRVEGPVAIAQLLEAPLLNLVNYASLVATNAARYRVAAGPNSVRVSNSSFPVSFPLFFLSQSHLCLFSDPSRIWTSKSSRTRWGYLCITLLNHGRV